MKVLIPCVNYADMLEVILPAWRAVLPDEAQIIVASSQDDHATAEVCAAHPGVRRHQTDAWYRDGAAFNKALAMDEALGIAGPLGLQLRLGEALLALDVDVYPFGTFPALSSLALGTIYGCARYRCATPADLEAHRAGRTSRRALDLIPPKLRGQSYTTIENTRANAVHTASKCLGYFQLCRWAPGLHFGSHRSAGKYDLDFRDQFPRRVGLESIYVLHLGEQDRRNWTGRVVPQWRTA